MVLGLAVLMLARILGMLYITSSGEISKDDYDNWRYHYPEFDTTQIWAKVPSQELSDALVKMLKSDK